MSKIALLILSLPFLLLSCTSPTPRESVAIPEFSPTPAQFSKATLIAISTSTADADIYFTLDGSAPSAGSTAYTEPFVVGTTTTVKSIALKAGYDNSPVAEGVFAITSVTRDDFPASAQANLDSLIAGTASNGGFAVAGRVTMSDGVAIATGLDAMVNFQSGHLVGVDVPTHMYAGGWFVMQGPLAAAYSGTGRYLFARAFGYDGIDAIISVPLGRVTYVNFEMQKTPATLLATISGTVRDEQGQPFQGAAVSLAFPFSNYGVGSTPYRQVTTLADGLFSFDGLSADYHGLTAFASGHAFNCMSVRPAGAQSLVQDLSLYPYRTVTIDYVYQPDGTRSFTSGAPQSGTLSWTSGGGGVDFSTGTIQASLERDIDLDQALDVLTFKNFYVDGANGFYDAGSVSVASISTANETGYATGALSCQVGHVYVVKTITDHFYAKFIVKAIN